MYGFAQRREDAKTRKDAKHSEFLLRCGSLLLFLPGVCYNSSFKIEGNISHDRTRNQTEVPGLLCGTRPSRRQKLAASARERSFFAVYQRGDEPVQGCIPRPRASRLQARGFIAEGRASGRKTQRPR